MLYIIIYTYNRKAFCFRFVLRYGGERIISILVKISSWFTAILIAVAVLLAVLLVGVRLLGITPYTVISGSMEPTYHVGSVIYIKEVDTDTLKVGDPITYKQSSGLVVTHRIIEVIESETGKSYRTKGDANDTADGGAVPALYVMGKPLFSIPFLGYISNFVQNPPGIFIVIGVVMISILLSLLRPANTEDKPEKPENI